MSCYLPVNFETYWKCIVELVTISEFKRFCEPGDYKAEVFLVDQDWAVRLTGEGRQVYLSHSRNKTELRKFKTLDAVFKALYEMSVFVFTVDTVLNPNLRAS